MKQPGAAKWFRSKLVGALDLASVTREEFAESIGITYPTLQKRLDGTRPFTDVELSRIGKKYGMWDDVKEFLLRKARE